MVHRDTDILEKQAGKKIVHVVSEAARLHVLTKSDARKIVRIVMISIESMEPVEGSEDLELLLEKVVW